MAQLDKDPQSSLLHLGLLLWHRFCPWSGNFCMLLAGSKKKKKKIDTCGGVPFVAQQVKNLT